MIEVFDLVGHSLAMASILGQAPRRLSDLGSIYCAGGRAAQIFPIFRCVGALCALKSGKFDLALPPCSLRSPKSDSLPPRLDRTAF